MLKLVVQKKYFENNLLESVKKYLVKEYNNQYKKDITSTLDNDSLIAFLNSISWNFEVDNEKEYKHEVLKMIKDSEFAHFTNPHQPGIVYAVLMLALEEKQDETDTILKFLRKDSVENFFLKVAAGQEIDIKARKYLSFDFTELQQKNRIWLESFLEKKYFSNVNDKSFPVLIERKVARHNREIKIEKRNLEQTDPEKAQQLDVVIKDLGDLINDSKPTFLFGEIGSGKSTLLAHYFLNEIGKNDVLSIFIPSTYLKGRIFTDTKSLKSVINDFVNEELNLDDKSFELDIILLTKKEITLIVDGIDELDFEESQKLLSHLLNLSNSSINLRIVASGRPIELMELIHFNQWNCLTTLDLTENEIKLLLKNEAIASGIIMTEAEKDALQRWKILKTKPELLANAITPLVVCLIRDFLDVHLSSKSLGDILYEVLKRRLDWHKVDQKENFSTFLGTYPHILQRENFIAPIAYRLYLNKDGKINEDALFQVIDSVKIVPNGVLNRGVLVNEAINFVKSNFLQKIGENYVFQSHQLHQLTIGLHLYKTITAGEELQFKGERVHSWREISFAASIARRKDDSGSIEKYIGEVIDELVFTKDNTPASAILLAETQISNLNLKFLEKIKVLGFRPLKSWGQSDSLVPQAYAYIIKDIGEVGFNWFFDEYLNPKYPYVSGHDEMAVLILQYYLIRSNFDITQNEKNKLRSVITFHLAAKTYSCSTLLPTISLVVPENFEVRSRCILITDALRNNVLKDKVEELLRNELSKGEKEAVVNALEIACRNQDYYCLHALELWFELVDGDIPKHILDSCIIQVGNGGDDLFPIMNLRVGGSNLEAYCRFNILNKSSISDSAAILLYQYYGERNSLLLGEPVIKKSQWFDYKNLQREKILNDVISSNKKGEEYIIRNLPSLENKAGIPELYLKYFLKSIQKSELLHINDFLLVVRNLNKFSLPRYAEIREGFYSVLSNIEYYNSLKDSIRHLDSHLRYNAASVLVVCNLQDEKEALEIIIRSVSKRLSDNHELLRLCMKLNYSESMLDFIYDLLNDLTSISKTFAIKLLYHNQEYKITTELSNEMIAGLIGDANFLDWSGHLSEDGVEQVVGKEKFYNAVRNELNSDELKIKKSASSSLISYYSNKLSIGEKAYCWLLYAQYSHYALIDFHNKFQVLFDDYDFVQELKEKAKVIEDKYDLNGLLFLKYYEAIKENGSWKDFFLVLLKSGGPPDHHRLEFLYGWIIQLGNSNKSFKIGIGLAIKDIMAYPSISQDHQYNFLLPQLAILAHEFEQLNNPEITEILTKYRISQEEVACGLLFRLGGIPNGFQSQRGHIEHISLFSSHKIIPFNPISYDDLNILLEDGEDIPQNLTMSIESVLLKGNLSDEDLLKLSAKGNLGTYFSIVVSFSRNSKLKLEDFAKGEDIGSLKYFAKGRTQYHKSILLKIKEVLLFDDDFKSSYLELLVDDITDKTKERDVFDMFTELFRLKADFDAKLLVILFDGLLRDSYRCNLEMVFRINEYVVKLAPDKQQLLIEPFRRFLKTVNNTNNELLENNLELISWTLSLILLYLEKKVDEDIERGFLTGLKNIFIQTNKQKFVGENHSTIQFGGRDLLINSDIILKQIDPQLLQKIIKTGSNSNVPEISAVCAMFSVFAIDA